jgi:hypothetical protein
MGPDHHGSVAGHPSVPDRDPSINGGQRQARMCCPARIRPMTSVDGFRPGQTLFRRYLRGPHVTRVQATTVVADDARGLVLWLPDGADFACRVDADGRPRCIAGAAGIPDGVVWHHPARSLGR